MKSITLRVKPNHSCGELTGSYRGEVSGRTIRPIETAGLTVPKRRYRVRFTADLQGPLTLMGGDFLRTSEGFQYHVCFLHHTGWPVGQHVKRQILPWSSR